MLVFILRRLAQAVLVMLTVAFLAFMLFQYVGDPVTNLLGQDATQEQRDSLRSDLGLDQPFPVQFARFVGNAVQGDFGLSLRQGRKVSSLIIERFPATLELSLAAAIIALAVGLPLGVYAALRRGSFGSQLVMTLSLLGVSLPTFLIGILLILFFSVTLKWLPSFGRGEVVALGAWTTGFLTVDGWKHIILPAITLSVFQLALIMRLVRAEMLEVLRTDYVKFARARGLEDRAVYFGHALKNTLVPVITITGLQLGSLIAFAIITETVFQWPGMGFLFIQAVQFADIPVMAAYLCLIALIFVVVNLIVDLLYFAVDPACASKSPRADTESMSTTTPAAPQGAIARFFDGDVWYSFTQSPMAILAAVIAAVCVFCSVFAPWVAPHNPFDLATLNLSDARLPPAWEAEGSRALSAGHRRPGPRHPVGADVRHAHLAVRGLRLGAAVDGGGRGPGAAVGLCRRQGRRLHHARVRRDAVVPGDPGGAADRRRGPRAPPTRTTRWPSAC
jgi:peptide/nickel transport system permease protein